MPNLFAQLDAKLAGNNVSVNITVQGDSLIGIGTTIEKLISEPPAGIGDLLDAVKNLPLPPLKVGGDLALTLDSLKLALPSDLSSLTGSLTLGLVDLKAKVNEDLVATLKAAVDTALALYNLRQIDLRCEDSDSAAGATGGGASGGAGAGAGATGDGTGDGSTPGGGASGGAGAGTPAQKSSLEQVAALVAALPAPFDVEKLLIFLHDLLQIPQRESLIPIPIPVIDDLLDPIDTLLAWKAMTSAEIRGHIAGTLQATESFILKNRDAALGTVLGDVASLAAKMQANVLTQIADDLTARLSELRAAMKGGNLSGTGAIVAAVNDLLAQYDSLRSTLQSEVLVKLPDLRARLTALPDDLDDQMSHVVSVLQPNGALGHLETFNEPIEAVSDAALAEVEKSLSTITVWLEDLVSKIDLSAIEQPLKTVADQTQAAVDALDNSTVGLTLEVQKLFGEADKLLDKVDAAAIASQVKAATEEFRADLSKQLTSLFAPVRDALHQIITTVGQGVDSFDVQSIASSLQEVIKSLTEVLDSGDVKDALNKVKDALGAISAQVEVLSFAPVTDQVIAAIDEVAAILESIDTSLLPGPMQMALQAALAVLPEDLKPIIDPLADGFDKLIESGPVPLVEKVQLQPQKLLDSIRQFEPAALLGNKLSGPYKEALGKMEGFKPSALLEPVQQEINNLKERLKEDANPGQAIKPLEEPFAQLLEVFDQLKPEEIVKPLEDAIKDVTDSILKALPIEETLNQVDEALKSVDEALAVVEHIATILQKLQDLLSGFADGETQMTTWVNSVLEKLDGINDTGPIEQRFAALAVALDSTRAAQLTAQLNGTLDPLLVTLNAVDGQARLTALVQAHRACKQELEKLSASPEKAAIEAVLNKFNPIEPSFSAPYQSLADWKKDLDTVKTGIGAAMIDWDARYHSADGVLACFRRDQVTGADLRLWVEEALGPQIVKPLAKLFAILEQAGRLLAPLISQIEKLVTKLQSKISGLLTGKDSLGGITDNLKEVVQRLKDFNLKFVSDSLKDLFAEVRAKFDALNPANLRKVVEEEFDKLLNTIDVGQVIPPADVKKMDDDYAKVIDKLKALDPEALIIKVVQPEFEEKILPLLDAFNVTVVLTALLDKLHGLAAELRKELDRLNEAYKALRKAVPSISLTDISLEVDISVSF